MRKKSPVYPRDKEIYRQVIVIGTSIDEAARMFRVRRSTIERSIRRMKRHLTDRSDKILPLVVPTAHLETLVTQWHELMAAWQHSKQEHVTRRATTDSEGGHKAELIHKSLSGDPRYLEQARQVMAEVRRLLGVGERTNIEEILYDVEELTLEERRNRFTEALDRIRECQRDESDDGLDRGDAQLPPVERDGGGSTAEWGDAA